MQKPFQTVFLLIAPYIWLNYARLGQNLPQRHGKCVICGICGG